MAVVAAALAVATGAPMQRSGAYTDLGAVGFTFLSTMIIVGLFEEVGWRGLHFPGCSVASMLSGPHWYSVSSGHSGIYPN